MQSPEVGIKFCNFTSFVIPQVITLKKKYHLVFGGLIFLIYIIQGGSLISLISLSSEFLDFIILGYDHLVWGQSHSQGSLIRLLTTAAVGENHYKALSIGP